jgi:hypothetical protein
MSIDPPSKKKGCKKLSMQHGREMASFSEERKDEHDKLMMVGRSMRRVAVREYIYAHDLQREK